MKAIPASLNVVALLSVALGGYAAPVTSPTEILLHEALTAQGGEEKLRAIQTVQWEGAGYRNELEESERPEGPYVTDFLALSEVDDYVHARYRSRTETSVYPLYKVVSTVVMSDGIAMQVGVGPFSAATPAGRAAHARTMSLNPERLLLTAADAHDLRRERMSSCNRCRKTSFYSPWTMRPYAFT